MSHSPDQSVAPPGGAPAIDYLEIEDSSEFRELKRKHRSFVFPLAIGFLVWYFGYVLLAAFAPEFMAIPLWGMNVGLWLGLGQFATTFAITMGYVSFANRVLDPRAAAIRERLETQELAHAEEAAS